MNVKCDFAKKLVFSLQVISKVILILRLVSIVVDEKILLRELDMTLTDKVYPLAAYDLITSHMM